MNTKNTLQQLYYSCNSTACASNTKVLFDSHGVLEQGTDVLNVKTSGVFFFFIIKLKVIYVI